MKKRQGEKRPIYLDKELKHYLGALAENYNENLKIIKEGSILTNKKLEGITQTLDQHTQVLDQHTQTLDLHTQILAQHTQTLSQHTDMIGILMEDVSILKDDMQIVKKELKKKVDYDEFLSLVQRVNKLETKI